MGFSLTPWIELIISIAAFIGVDYYCIAVKKKSAMVANVINAVIGFLFLGLISQQFAPIAELLEIVAYIYLLLKNKQIVNLMSGDHLADRPRSGSTPPLKPRFDPRSSQCSQSPGRMNNEHKSVKPTNNPDQNHQSRDQAFKQKQLAQIKKAQELMKQHANHHGNNIDSDSNRSLRSAKSMADQKSRSSSSDLDDLDRYIH